MVWEKNGTPDDLASSGSSMEITDLTAKTFNQFLCHGLQSGNIRHNIQLDGVTNTDYADRQSENGGADATDASQVQIQKVSNGATADQFTVSNAINIDGEEKLVISHSVGQGGSGAGSAPNRRENVGKMDTTTNSGQFTQVKFLETETGSYATDSNLSAISTD